MSSVNNNTNIFTDINTAYQKGSTTAAQSESQEDSDMFMRLMIAQLQNQDPTSPTDTADYMAQISNMQQVESTNNLTNAVNKMSSSLLTSQSALQASSMVGQNVVIATDKTLSDDEGDIAGQLQVPGKTENIRLKVYDKNNVEVDIVNLGQFEAGTQDFKWSGDKESAGQEYRLVAEAQAADGNYVQINTFLTNKVTSVTLGQNGVGMAVNTAVGSTAMENVLQIGL